MILWYGMVNVNFYSAIITKVSNVQYQYFLFYILLIWGCVRTQRTPLPTGLHSMPMVKADRARRVCARRVHTARAPGKIA